MYSLHVHYILCFVFNLKASKYLCSKVTFAVVSKSFCHIRTKTFGSGTPNNQLLKHFSWTASTHPL